MASRAFLWLRSNGGAWSLASNWDDLTDGTDPSLVVPGAQDSVTVTGPAGTGNQTITGPGMAASALFTGNTTLSGSFGFGTLTVGGGGAGGLLVVAPASVVQAGGVSLATGSLVVNGTASQLAVSGTLTLGAGQNGTGAPSATLDATTGALVQTASLALDSSAAHIYVDPSSIVEAGSAGGAVAGELTIDPGQRVAGFGDLNAYGAVTNDGTIAAAGGLLQVGRLTGTGTLEIDAGAALDLNGPCGAGQSVVFAGGLGTLAISAEAYAPAGTLTGFAPGDAIDILGSPISQALYAPTTPGFGLLTLTYGTQIAASFTLAGDYSQNVFLTNGDGGDGTLISVVPSASGGTGPSGGTATPDQYRWVAPSSGKWNAQANWSDITTGRNPAAKSPGVNDLVTIAAPSAGFEVIAGPANAATLGITGELALSGVFDFGALTIGDGTGAVPGTLDLLPGTTIANGAATIADGAIAVAGAGSVLSVAGTLTLGGGILGVGLPTATLTVTAGGRVQAGSLTLGGGSGDWITTDPTGSIEIGTAGGAQAGALTVDAGAALSGNGSINPYSTVIDQGSITAQGGTLTLGQVSGTGTLAIAGGATLELISPTALGIMFTGPAATLAFSSELAAPTGQIAGFVPGDVIDVEGDPIDNAVFAKDPSGTSGTLTLFYGATAVAHLKLAGSFTNQHFLTAPDGLGGTDVLLSAYGGGGGGGGQGNTDLLAWAQPVSGSWATTHLWQDLTTGKPATAPPGAQNLVQIAGPTGTTFQTIGGPGVCASLAFTGNTLLSSSFTATTVTIGTVLGDGTVQSGFVELNGNPTLSATQASVLAGNLLVSGTGVSASVSGTLTVGGAGVPAEISAQARGSVRLGALSLLGGGLDTDNAGWIEIGSAGGAAAGAITIDAGSIVSGSGSLNASGVLVDNGGIIASGGTLLLGNTAGSGMLSIGTEATLSLAGTESNPIDFTGGGGTLILPGSAMTPSGVISDFAPGDSIVTGGSPLSDAVWQPGAGGIGTLTLYFGGQVAGSLLLAGDYSGETFTVQPGDGGAQITVQGFGGGAGPSPGTANTDSYLWTGAVSTDWNQAGNWTDTTAGQNPAAIAPGQHDLVTIQGPAQGYQQIAGPADAASLTLLGNVALGGLYAIGSLDVGGATVTGLLALQSGTTVDAADGMVLGAISAAGGTLAVQGGLVLGGSTADGVLSAASGSVVTAGSLTLDSPGSVAATDAASSIEIGGNPDGTFSDAVTGAIVIDAGGEVAGEGSVNLLGSTVDDGTIVAQGGTLDLGDVSGTGTLRLGPDATLVLGGAVGAGLTIDFTAAGTLTLANGMLAAGITGFGTGDQILLPGDGATSAQYAATGAGIGTLTIYAGTTIADQLTLLGADPASTYAVAEAAGGGTILTAMSGNSSGNGGGNMGTPPTQSGAEDPATFLASMPYYAQSWLAQSIGEGTQYPLTPYVWVSADGSDFSPPILGFAYANIGVVEAPVAMTAIAAPAGYKAVVLEGNTAVGLVDNNTDGTPMTLIGNTGNDTIVGLDGDTLVGGAGAQTVFAVNSTVTIQGGGNDLYNTGIGNVTIFTSTGASLVGLGPASNLVTTYGTDTVACLGGNIANDTVDASHSARQTVVFGPAQGSLEVIGGGGPAIVVGGAGQVVMYGGAGGNASAPNELWCTSGFSEYIGGSGAGAVIGGSGDLTVQAGTGPVTVWGGTGAAHITGSAGDSAYVVGLGATTITAAANNFVYGVGSAAISVTGSGDGVYVWAAASTANDTLQSGAGYETMAGGAGNDIFRIGNGQGAFEGFGGADSYDFTNGLSGGSATVYDFNTAQDHIGLAGYAGGAAAVLSTAVVSDGNTHLTLQDGTQLTLIGVTNLTAGSFVVT